jgi:hypothetical protein
MNITENDLDKMIEHVISAQHCASELAVRFPILLDVDYFASLQAHMNRVVQALRAKKPQYMSVTEVREFDKMLKNLREGGI